MNILIIITYNYHVMLVYMFKPGPSSLHGICNKISAVYEFAWFLFILHSLPKSSRTFEVMTLNYQIEVLTKLKIAYKKRKGR